MLNNSALRPVNLLLAAAFLLVFTETASARGVGAYSLFLNGENSYVEASRQRVSTGRDNFTYELWFKPGEAAGTAGLMGVGRGDRSLDRPGINLRYIGPNTIHFMAANRKYRVTLSHWMGERQEGWIHAAAVVDREGRAKLVLNGEIVDEADAARFKDDDGFDVRELHLSTRGAFRAGRRPYSNIAHFKGAIAEVRVWRRALQIEEIRENMNRELTGREEGLLLYWPLNEGQGQIAYDRTGNGNHGRIFNGIWKEENTPVGRHR